MAKELWRKKNVKRCAESSVDGLLGVHVRALQDNSDNLIALLQVLSERKEKLSPKELSQIKKMKKELNSIDKKIDNLGSTAEEDEEDYFEF